MYIHLTLLLLVVSFNPVAKSVCGWVVCLGFFLIFIAFHGINIHVNATCRFVLKENEHPWHNGSCVAIFAIPSSRIFFGRFVGRG